MLMDNSDVRDKLKLLYKVLIRISLSGEPDWKTKIYVNTALSYFIIPEDVVPEKNSEQESYVDDFYICLLVFNELRKYRYELINKIFSEYIKEDIDKFLSENLHQCEMVLGDKVESIKKEVGYDSLKNINLHDKGFSITMNQELLGIVAFCTMN